MKPMRFECDSCHAKYKISDDKVRGRVVRFPCRRCEHRILIDGRERDPDVTVPAGSAYAYDEVTRRSEPASTFAHEAPTARVRRSSAPARRRPPSVPPRRPSAMSRRLSSTPAAASSAFIGQHPGLAPPVPRTGPSLPKVHIPDRPEWHVSINDVPIGPVRLEEMAHKIDAKAVSEYSLVWREGFDEWRPLATVPELMALLHDRRHSGPPARTAFSSMPPFVDSRTSGAGSRQLAARPSAPAGASAARASFAPLTETRRSDTPGVLREMSQPPAPIGPAAVFQSSPQLGAFSGLPAATDEEVSVPSVPPPTAATAAEPRRAFSIGGLAVIVAVAVFSGVLAFLAFDRFGERLMTELLGGSQPVAVAPPVRAAVPPPPPPAEPGADADESAEDSAAEEVHADPAKAAAEVEAAAAKKPQTDSAALQIEPPKPADDGPKMAPREPPRPKVRPNPPPEADSLSAEDRKLLSDFSSSSAAAPAKIDVAKSGSSQSAAPPLDAEAVSTTVAKNKARLQRCYERAVRGQPSPPTARLDVNVMVASSGRVKEVSALGTGPGGLAECVEATVRRWRFPASSEGGPAKFPLVFSAGN